MGQHASFDAQIRIHTGIEGKEQTIKDVTEIEGALEKLTKKDKALIKVDESMLRFANSKIKSLGLQDRVTATTADVYNMVRDIQDPDKMLEAANTFNNRKKVVARNSGKIRYKAFDDFYNNNETLLSQDRDSMFKAMTSIDDYLRAEKKLASGKESKESAAKLQQMLKYGEQKFVALTDAFLNSVGGTEDDLANYLFDFFGGYHTDDPIESQFGRDEYKKKLIDTRDRLLAKVKKNGDFDSTKWLEDQAKGLTGVQSIDFKAINGLKQFSQSDELAAATEKYFKNLEGAFRTVAQQFGIAFKGIDQKVQDRVAEITQKAEQEIDAALNAKEAAVTGSNNSNNQKRLSPEIEALVNKFQESHDKDELVKLLQSKEKEVKSKGSNAKFNALNDLVQDNPSVDKKQQYAVNNAIGFIEDYVRASFKLKSGKETGQAAADLEGFVKEGKQLFVALTSAFSEATGSDDQLLGKNLFNQWIKENGNDDNLFDVDSFVQEYSSIRSSLLNELTKSGDLSLINSPYKWLEKNASPLDLTGSEQAWKLLSNFQSSREAKNIDQNTSHKLSSILSGIVQEYSKAHQEDSKASEEALKSAEKAAKESQQTQKEIKKPETVVSKPAIKEQTENAASETKATLTESSKDGIPVNINFAEAEEQINNIKNKIEEIKKELTDIPISFDTSQISKLEEVVSKLEGNLKNLKVGSEQANTDEQVVKNESFITQMKTAFEGFSEAVNKLSTIADKFNLENLGTLVSKLQETTVQPFKAPSSGRRRKAQNALTDETAMSAAEAEAAQQKLIDAFQASSKYNASKIAVSPQGQAYMNISWANEKNELVTYKAELQNYKDLLDETGKLQESIVDKTATAFVSSKQNAQPQKLVDALNFAGDKTGKNFTIDNDSIKVAENGVVNFTAALTEANGVVKTYKLSIEDLWGELAKAGTTEGSKVFTKSGGFRKNGFLNSAKPEIDDSNSYTNIIKNGFSTLLGSVQGKNKQSLADIASAIQQKVSKQGDQPEGFYDQILETFTVLQQSLLDGDPQATTKIEASLKSLLDTIGLKEKEQNQTISEMVSTIANWHAKSDAYKDVKPAVDSIESNTREIQSALGKPEEDQFTAIQALNSLLDLFQSKLKAQLDPEATEATIQKLGSEFSSLAEQLQKSFNDPESFSSVIQEIIPKMSNALSAFDPDNGEQKQITHFVAEMKSALFKMKDRGTMDSATFSTILQVLDDFNRQSLEVSNQSREHLEAISNVASKYGSDESAQAWNEAVVLLRDKLVAEQKERVEVAKRAAEKAVNDTNDPKVKAPTQKQIDAKQKSVSKTLDKLNTNNIAYGMKDVISDRNAEALKTLSVDLKDKTESQFKGSLQDLNKKILDLVQFAKSDLTDKPAEEIQQVYKQLEAADSLLRDITQSRFAQKSGKMDLVSARLTNQAGENLSFANGDVSPETYRSAIQKELAGGKYSLFNMDVGSAKIKDNTLSFKIELQDEVTGKLKQATAQIEQYNTKAGEASSLRIDYSGKEIDPNALEEKVKAQVQKVIGTKQEKVSTGLDKLNISNIASGMKDLWAGENVEALKALDIDFSDVKEGDFKGKLNEVVQRVQNIIKAAKGDLSGKTLQELDAMAQQLAAAESLIKESTKSKYAQKKGKFDLASASLKDENGANLTFEKTKHSPSAYTKSIESALKGTGYKLDNIDEASASIKDNVLSFKLQVVDEVSGNLKQVTAQIEQYKNTANEASNALRLDFSGKETAAKLPIPDQAELKAYYEGLQRIKTIRDEDDRHSAIKKYADVNKSFIEKYGFDPKLDIRRTASISPDQINQLWNQYGRYNDSSVKMSGFIQNTEMRGLLATNIKQIAGNLQGTLGLDLGNEISNILKASKITEFDDSTFSESINKLVQKVRFAMNQLKEELDSGLIDDSLIDGYKKKILEATNLMDMINKPKFKQNNKKFNFVDQFEGSLPAEKIESKIYELNNARGRIVESINEVRESNGVMMADITARDFGSQELKNMTVRFEEVSTEAGKAAVQVREFARASKMTKTPGQQLVDSWTQKVGQLMVYLSGIDIARRAWQQIKTGFTFTKELDSLMTTIRQTTDISGQGIKDLSQGAIDQAKQLGTTVENVTGAIDVYASMGESTESLLSKSAPTTMLAKAAGMDVKAASDVVQGVNLWRIYYVNNIKYIFNCWDTLRVLTLQ